MIDEQTTDKQLYQSALTKVGGRISDLAKACEVSRQAIYEWRDRMAADPPLELTTSARIRLGWAISGRNAGETAQ